MTDAAHIRRDDGTRLAYRRRTGRGPGVVWLGGFKSDMQGTKSQALEAWARDKDRAFVTFDYFGHGESEGDFRAGTVSRWLADALMVIDRLTEGPQILVGSSMGGFLALHAALTRPARVLGLLLIAPAVDFTEDLFWNTFPDDVRQAILARGEWAWPSRYDDAPYPITRGLIEDGRKHLLLGGPVPIAVPVRILQGMADPDVPWTHAMRLVAALGPDTRITLLKDGDHRLSKPHEIAVLLCLLEAMPADGEHVISDRPAPC